MYSYHTSSILVTFVNISDIFWIHVQHWSCSIHTPVFSIVSLCNYWAGCLWIWPYLNATLASRGCWLCVLLALCSDHIAKNHVYMSMFYFKPHSTISFNWSFDPLSHNPVATRIFPHLQKSTNFFFSQSSHKKWSMPIKAWWWGYQCMLVSGVECPSVPCCPIVYDYKCLYCIWLM